MSNRSSHLTDKPAQATPARPDAAVPVRGHFFERLVGPWTRFWFSPADPIGLHTVRVLAGLVFLGWLLAFAGHQQSLFGLQGWFDREAYREASRLPEGPPLSWSALYLCGTDPTLLNVFYWSSVGVLVLFTLGIAVRLTAILTWVVVVSFSANPAFSFYGADELLGILAFYLMLGYVLLGQWSRAQSLASHLLGSLDWSVFGGWLSRRRIQRQKLALSTAPSHAANLALRLLQVHFAIIIVASGLHKLQFGDWWAGVAFWYPLHPPFEVTTARLKAEAGSAQSTLFILSLAQYLALAWQIGFPLFAWRKAGRLLVVIGGVAAWLGSALLLRQPTFGPVLFVACLSFVTPAEWRWIAERVARLSRLRSSASRAAVPPLQPVEAGARA